MGFSQKVGIVKHSKQRYSYPDGREESFKNVWHRDGEDGASGGDDPVDEAQVPLEVVTQDHQGRRVGQGRTAAEQDSVGET